MLKKPQFKSCFRVEVLPSQGIFLISETNSFFLSGSIYERIVPSIDGQRTVDEIAQQLQGKVSLPEVYYTLMQIADKGYLVEADNNTDSSEAIYWQLEGSNFETATQKFESASIAISTHGNIAPEIKNQFETALNDLGIKTGDAGQLNVVVTDNYLQPSLAQFNHTALQEKKPWLLVKPVGTTIWIGPLFVPGETGCWECMARRLRENRPTEAFIERQTGQTNPIIAPVGSLPTTVRTALSMAATEVAKWLVGKDNTSLVGQLITLNTQTLEIDRHQLIKQPQCPSCGDPQYKGIVAPDAIALQSRKKVFTTDGGHRCFSPQETVDRLQKYVSPLLGVVRDLRETSGNELTHAFIARHHFVTIKDDLERLRDTVSGRSGGKGRSEIQAKASGLCEAIERYSGIFEGYESRKKARYVDIESEAIHPYDCLLFSENQYRDRQNLDCYRESKYKIPDPFDPEEEIEWTPVYSLTYQRFKYLPTAYCYYYGYPPTQKIFCYGDSNGNAAGNCLEEAILQGFMELAERDAVALWWYNRIRRSGVDLESFNDRYFDELRSYYRSLHREFWVLDITSDLNIPTFAAISRRTDKAAEDITYGFGAHFDPKIALMRAVTELNQCSTFVAVEKNGKVQYPHSDRVMTEWLKTATIANQPYVLPDDRVSHKTLKDYGFQPNDDLREDILQCVASVENVGLELLVLDQTRPDIDLNVAKVIVPGLRHFWERLAPGRLYDVPVKMGWLDRPRSEQEMNPFPITI